jgi:DNA primase
VDADELFDLLQEIGIEHLVTRGHNIMGLCPFHQESTPSWGIKIEEPHLHGCFSCGAKGNLFTLLTQIGKMPVAKAKRLANVITSEMQLPTFKTKVEKEKSTFKTIDESELYPFVFTKKVEHYLRSRGVTPSVAERIGCVHDKNTERILFPWYIEKELVGVTGRTLTNNRAKTLPMFGTLKGQAFFLPQRKITSDPFIIVEGEIDALKIYCTALENLGRISRNIGAVGFGRFTDDQASLVLNSSCDEVIIATDDDNTGSLLRMSIFRKLSGQKRIHRVMYEPFKKRYRGKLDPGELTRKDICLMFTKHLKKNIDWRVF